MLRKLTFTLLLASAAAIAADSDFNGRWNITVPSDARHRAWWLEVEGAGTPSLHGRFVGFPGGDTKLIPKLWIERDELRYTWDLPNGGKQEYSVRLAAGKLTGSMKQGNTEQTFTGVRAPVIADHDDGSWKEGRPIELFNGKDVSGWHGQLAGKELGWTVEDGVLKSNGHANNLESDAKFWNFILRVEYRLYPHSNSGLGLRARYEIQIQDDYGKPLDSHMNGALYSRIAPSSNPTKPAGEWQTDEVRIVGRDLRVKVNGQEVVHGVIDGFTAIATDANEAEPGPLVLQGDHERIDFRRVTLIPLTK